MQFFASNVNRPGSPIVENSSLSWNARRRSGGCRLRLRVRRLRLHVRITNRTNAKPQASGPLLTIGNSLRQSLQTPGNSIERPFAIHAVRFDEKGELFLH
jgi:hypothetical protein